MSNNSPSKLFKCTHKDCHSVFSKKSKLEIHIRIHTGERPFECKIEDCDKKYTSGSHLKRHYQSCHVNKEFKQIYVCSKCNLSISSQSNLRRHYARIHDATRKYPFTCKECKAGFHRKQHLARHMFFHTGIPPYKCKTCEAGFMTLSRMNKHVSRHKQYICNECPAVYDRWSALCLHKKRMHFKKYRCEHCKKSFVSKLRLKMHTEIHSQTRDIFPCPENNCPRFYFYHRNLITHIRSIHKGIKYPCPYPECGLKLVSKSKRDTHLKKHYSNKTAKKRVLKSKRKDFNKPKRSAAIKLAGLHDIVSYDIEKQIMNGGIIDVTKVEESLIDSNIGDLEERFDSANDSASLDNESVSKTDVEITNGIRFVHRDNEGELKSNADDRSDNLQKVALIKMRLI